MCLIVHASDGCPRWWQSRMAELIFQCMKSTGRWSKTWHWSKPYDESYHKASEKWLYTRTTDGECLGGYRKVAAALVREISWFHRFRLSAVYGGMTVQLELGILSFLFFGKKKSLYSPLWYTTLFALFIFMIYFNSGFWLMSQIDQLPYAQFQNKTGYTGPGKWLSRLSMVWGFAIIGATEGIDRKKDLDSFLHRIQNIRWKRSNNLFGSFSNHA